MEIHLSDQASLPSEMLCPARLFSTRIRHQQAVALLAVAEGKSLSEAARLAGWKSHNPVAYLWQVFTVE